MRYLMVSVCLFVMSNFCYSQTIGVEPVETEPVVVKSTEAESVEAKPAEVKPVTDPLQDNIAKLIDKNPSVRRTAASNLGTLRNPASIPHLIKLLKDEDTFVRLAAIDSLGILRAKEASPELKNIFETEKSAQVRQGIAVAFGYIGDTSAVPVLIKGLKDPHDGTKFACAQTLGLMHSREAVQPLIEELKNPVMKRSALSALYLIGDTTASAAVRELFNDEDINIRIEAIRVAGALRDKESIATLNAFLKDKNNTVVVTSAESLANMEDNAGLAIAKKLVSDSDRTVRYRAINTLGLVGGRDCLSILKALKDDSSGVVERAIGMINSRFPEEKKSVAAKKSK